MSALVDHWMAGVGVLMPSYAAWMAAVAYLIAEATAALQANPEALEHFDRHLQDLVCRSRMWLLATKGNA